MMGITQPMPELSATTLPDSIAKLNGRVTCLLAVYMRLFLNLVPPSIMASDLLRTLDSLSASRPR